MNKFKVISAMFILASGIQSCRNTSGSIVPGGIESSEEIGTTTFVNHTTRSLSVTEFIDWCQDEGNGLKKSTEVGEMKYSLAFVPSAYMAFLELRTEEYDYEKFRKTMEHYSDMAYFNLKVEIPAAAGELLKYKLTSPAEYEKRIRYTSFSMQNDIYLIQNGDTLRPGLYQFERIFEVAPYATLMMAFDTKKFKRDKEFSLVYNDQLFEKGFIKFKYRNGQLVNLPNINGL